eukprot:1391959-Rhodomonas_salina.1
MACSGEQVPLSTARQLQKNSYAIFHLSPARAAVLFGNPASASRLPIPSAAAAARRSRFCGDVEANMA